MKGNKKLFYSILFLTLITLSLIIYISSVQPSKEEFIEVYWQVYRVENLTRTTQVNCSIDNCSLSGTYNLGNVNLDDKSFKVITTDLVKAGKHDSLCIDINEDGVYCDENEGPFMYRNTFLIGSDGFNILSFEKDIVIAHYPKEVNVQNFTVALVTKSHYSKTMNFTINLLVNETLEETRVLNLKPKEEIFSKFSVSLPTEGLFRVKIVVLSPTNKESSIDFWVKRI